MAAKATLVTLLNCKQEGAPEKKSTFLFASGTKKMNQRKHKSCITCNICQRAL